MDTFAHALWGGALAKAINLKRKSRDHLDARAAAVFAALPDIVAFGPLSAVMLFRLTAPYLDGLFPGAGELASGSMASFGATRILYSAGHSMFVFAGVFGAVWLIRKKPTWELLGWLSHIALDVPTHSLEYHATPFLWPFFDARFDGVPWHTPWVLAANYAALILVFITLRVLEGRRRAAEKRVDVS